MSKHIKARRIADWSFSSNDRLFFDTNIWLMLFEIQGNPSDSNISAYSLAYKRILREKSVILTDSLVLAEFANAAFRIRQDLAIRFSGAPEEFKEYRESEHYEYDAWSVCEFLGEIRTRSQVLSVEPPDDWPAFTAAVQTGARDFNDEMIVLQCRKHNAMLVTHDRDFSGVDISILTNRHTYFR